MDIFSLIARAKAVAAASEIPRYERLPFLVPGQVHVVRVRRVLKGEYETPLVLVESLSLGDHKTYRLPWTATRVALEAKLLSKKALARSRYGIVVATKVQAPGPICGYTPLASREEAKGLSAALKALAASVRDLH